MPSYAELQAEIQRLAKEQERLAKEAEQILKDEKLQVIADIRNKMNAYGISFEELQNAKVTTAPKRARGVLPMKYSDGQGNEWSGKGPKPLWLVKALENGKKLEDYLIQR